MKVLIAGSRSWSDYTHIRQVMDDVMDMQVEIGDPITEVISGTASGADQLGERWAAARNLTISRYPANWNRDGRAAGYIRNKEMVDSLDPKCDMVVVFWDGESRGSQHTITLSETKGVCHRVVTPNMDKIIPRRV